jgi:hypothetical protein
MQATWSQPVAEVVVLSNDLASRRARPSRPWATSTRLLDWLTVLAIRWLTPLTQEVVVARTLVTEIDINGSPQQVWQVLTDLAAYREWNPFILEAAGRPEAGERLTLSMRNVGGRTMTLRPTVTEARGGELLRWVGHLMVRGILDVEHSFVLERRGEGATRLVQQERFGGVLVPFIERSLDRGTLPAFALMNEALKRRVEQSVSAQRG